MPRIAYVNGRFVRHKNAGVSIDDRGYQFADGVYEVWSVFGGRLGDLKGHLDRLERSLFELSIPMPKSRAALVSVIQELIRRNYIWDGLVYLQITRGVMLRDHAWTQGLNPVVVMTAKPVDQKTAAAKAAKGIRAVTRPDIRWGRCDIKSTSLLPNILAKHDAALQGAQEAIFIDRDGLVSEGSSTTVYIVAQDGYILTRSLSANILPGITRQTLFELIKTSNYKIEEKAFSKDQLLTASEVFITAASTLVMPVIEVDHQPIGDGRPGPVALSLREAYLAHVRATAGVE